MVSEAMVNLLGLHAGKGLVEGTGLQKRGHLTQQSLCHLPALLSNALVHGACQHLQAPRQVLIVTVLTVARILTKVLQQPRNTRGCASMTFSSRSEHDNNACVSGHSVNSF